MSAAHIATLDENGWTLDDGEQAHRRNPETFWIPSRQQRESLKAGDLAKLRFVLALVDDEGNEEMAAERMWVEVTESADGWYRGVLKNQPASTEDALIGMEVWFQPRHVIDVLFARES